MDGVELERLERLIRNTPAENVQLERCDSKWGEIFYAYGAGLDGTIYGIWGIQGVARTVEFKDGTRLEDVRQVLVNDAAAFVELRAERGLIG